MVIYRNEPLRIEKGTTFLDVARTVQKDYDAPIILAKIGQRLIELNKEIPADEEQQEREMTFITTKERDGHRTYERGATMMFLRAMRRVFGKRIVLLRVEYSIGDALYFSVSVKDDAGVVSDDIPEERIAEVKATMERYVRENDEFIKTRQPTEKVVQLFARYGMTDKQRLFHYRRSSVANVYRLGNYEDYFYGYMPPTTGHINVFDLKKAVGGILLVLPKRSEPEKPGSPVVPEKLFATMRQTNIWGENIGVSTVAALNDAISRGEGRDMILASEAYQEHLIGEAARRIKQENRRIVMIAGPSSSGKTTFSHRLSIQLNNVGLKAHPIACDNYYLRRELAPKDENGEYDFECLEALDVELFNRQMTALLRGESVRIPTYNFKTGAPDYTSDPLRIRNDDVLVIEGIHCLNDKLSYAVRPEDKFKIYISALTALNIDEHNRVSTTDNREIRRMVRDAKTRGFSASETILRWNSVRHGEERHIFPYQEDADIMFNSASLYELAVLKIFAEPLLFSIPDDSPAYPEAKRLLKFLEYFLGLSPEDVPCNSIVREFIGGSVFPVG
ncbi:MAG: nucleoside kinase [Eubacteriales bacterium]|nr:nucleoside kinase [Eubacteriales bacterium]